MIAPLILGLALIALGAVVVLSLAALTDPDDYPPRANPDPAPQPDLSLPVSEFDEWAVQALAVANSRIDAAVNVTPLPGRRLRAIPEQRDGSAS